MAVTTSWKGLSDSLKRGLRGRHSGPEGLTDSLIQ